MVKPITSVQSPINIESNETSHRGIGTHIHQVANSYSNAPHSNSALSTRQSISQPMNLRPLDSDIRYHNQTKHKFELEISCLHIAKEKSGATTTAVTSLEELRKVVFPNDNAYHKFVLSSDDQLAIHSISIDTYLDQPKALRRVSHAALAQAEGIDGLNGTVKCAGTIRAANDGHFIINNSSGHYKTSKDSLKHMQAKLALWGSIPEIRDITEEPPGGLRRQN
ncbi:hypothetical protein [Spartinivicinus ruber]|uniref:hypothetical protein n=1 Tax=Spartinivicinus ruber TaxID=2683272 RepID=UPI0013D27C15|nr:hypothetical protein [Spartinivicinus ruber]